MLSGTAHEVVNVDKLTYAGNLDSLAAVAGSDRYHFEHVDICDGAALRARCSARIGPDAVMHLAAEPRRPLDRRAAAIRPDQHRRHLRPAGGGARATGSRWPASTRAAFRFLHVSTDEVYGSLGARRRPFTRDHAPTSRTRRTRPPRRRPTTWCAPGTTPTGCRCDHQLLEQLRAVQFPGEADPADDPQRARRQAAAGLRRRPAVRDWLYVDDHCAALCAVLERGGRARPTTSAAGTRRRNIDVVHDICALLDELAPAQATARTLRDLITLRAGPAGPRPPLRDRRRQDRARTRLDAARDLRDRPAEDRALVSGQPATGWQRVLRRRVPAGAASDAGAVMHAAQGHHPGRRLAARGCIR